MIIDLKVSHMHILYTDPMSGGHCGCMSSTCVRCYSDKLIIVLLLYQVNDELFDLDRPLEEDCNLKLLNFNEDEGISYITQQLLQLTTPI